MNFDVVIPTKNRTQDLDRLIESINQQTMLPHRVVIVDQSPQIQIRIESSKYEVLHLHVTNITGLCAAKNLGVQKCTSEIIHFFDDDIILDPNYFEIINKHMEEHPHYVGICGRQKNSKSSRLKLLAFSLFHIGAFYDIRKKCNSGFVKQSLTPTRILPGGITAYRKSIFRDFQFDETLIRYCLGEDMDFSFRVSQNHSLAFATDALALHNHSLIGRYDAQEAYACKIAGYSYFYNKNLTNAIYDTFSYSLVILGVIVDALCYAISNKNLDSIQGLFKGFKYLKHNYQDVPFIDSSRLQSKKKHHTTI